MRTFELFIATAQYECKLRMDKFVQTFFLKFFLRHEVGDGGWRGDAWRHASGDPSVSESRCHAPYN